MGLKVDVEAELRVRTARGGRAPLHAEHPLVVLALWIAHMREYCRQLEPFGKKVAVALKHGARAGSIPRPPSPPPTPPAAERVANRHPALERTGGWNALYQSADAAHKAATRSGVKSPEFNTQARRFYAIWDALRRDGLLGEQRGVRGGNVERETFLLALAGFVAPLYRLGPAGAALLASVVGVDEAIWCKDDETVAEALARRAERYRKPWPRAKRRAARFRRRYMVAPGRPLAPARSDGRSIAEPSVQLPTGETIVKRPKGLPQRANLFVRRRKVKPKAAANTTAAEARLRGIWTWGGRHREMSLGRIAPISTEHRRRRTR